MNVRNRTPHEMPIEEWMTKAPCALLSFAIALATAAGAFYCAVAGVKAATVADNNLLLLAVLLAALSTAWGVPGMAKAINNVLVRALSWLYARAR